MKSILLASSNIEQVITLTNLLQKRGYVVIPAPDEEFALSLLSRGIQVDAVIADHASVDLPGLMGAVRSHAPVPPAVIVTSDRVAVSDYLAALSLGVFEFLFWPIRPAELVRIVAAAVSRNSADSGAGGHAHEAAGPARYTGGVPLPLTR